MLGQFGDDTVCVCFVITIPSTARAFHPRFFSDTTRRQKNKLFSLAMSTPARTVYSAPGGGSVVILIRESRDVYPTSGKCCASVGDAGTALARRWIWIAFNKGEWPGGGRRCHYGRRPKKGRVITCRCKWGRGGRGLSSTAMPWGHLPDKQETLTQGWYNVGPPSTTAAQHCTSLEWTLRVFWVMR